MKIVLEHLLKRYKKHAGVGDVIAVNDFNFEIPDGKLVGLLGPSGCGKSTTLNLISGLEKPTSGKIYFGDEDVTGLPPEKRGIGLVFQNYALYPHLTVKENIAFPLENLRGAEKLTKEEINAKVLEAAKMVSIDRLLDRRPGEMSGGQQQRVAIARALVKRPKVLLLDEPLSNLDARLRLQTREEIRRLQQETGITTVFVTHDQEEAMSISDEIVLMQAGVVQQIGAPQEVYDRPANLFAARFLGTPAIHVFDAEVRDRELLIGGAAVLSVSNVPEGKVYAGVRPEGFTPDDDGPLEMELQRIEVMGRDRSIVAAHPACTTGAVRAIIDGETPVDTSRNTVRFSLRRKKVLLFSAETEERIDFGE